MVEAQIVRPTPFNEPGFCHAIIASDLIDKLGKRHAFARSLCAS